MTAATRISQVSYATLLAHLGSSGRSGSLAGHEEISLAKQLWRLRLQLDDALRAGHYDAAALLRLRQLGRRHGPAYFQYRCYKTRFEQAGLSPYGGLASV